jgi:predicted secreted protein
MRLTSIFAIYLLIWTLTLFAVLPVGVKTYDEAGTERVPGQADSAPDRPDLKRKLLLTTIIATAFFALFYANYMNGWVTMDDILPSVRPPNAPR